MTDARRAELEGQEITEELLEKMRMAVTASAFCTPEVSSAAIIHAFLSERAASDIAIISRRREVWRLDEQLRLLQPLIAV